jgi:RimJ/RimL family protein N-acetyltransferase
VTPSRNVLIAVVAAATHLTASLGGQLGSAMPAPRPTPRLAFREMTPDDLDDMAALLGDPQVMRYYPHPKSREDALAWITWNQRLYRDHGFGLWLLRLRETGEFVGDCGLTLQQVDGVTEIEVGYHVRVTLQGRGLATEAAAACRDHTRDVLGLERLIAIIDLHNRPSQRVAEKLGMVVERDSDNHGRWSSPQHIYAMSLARPQVSGGPARGNETSS